MLQIWKIDVDVHWRDYEARKTEFESKALRKTLQSALHFATSAMPALPHWIVHFSIRYINLLRILGKWTLLNDQTAKIRKSLGSWARMRQFSSLRDSSYFKTAIAFVDLHKALTFLCQAELELAFQALNLVTDSMASIDSTHPLLHSMAVQITATIHIHRCEFLSAATLLERNEKENFSSKPLFWLCGRYTGAVKWLKGLEESEGTYSTDSILNISVALLREEILFVSSMTKNCLVECASHLRRYRTILLDIGSDYREAIFGRHCKVFQAMCALFSFVCDGTGTERLSSLTNDLDSPLDSRISQYQYENSSLQLDTYASKDEKREFPINFADALRMLNQAIHTGSSIDLEAIQNIEKSNKEIWGSLVIDLLSKIVRENRPSNVAYDVANKVGLINIEYYAAKRILQDSTISAKQGMGTEKLANIMERSSDILKSYKRESSMVIEEMRKCSE